MSGRRGNNPTANGGAASRTSTMNGSRASTRSNRSRRSTPQDTFHPKLITAQIVSMQCFHYFLLGFLFQVNYVLYNKPITVDRIFTDKYVRLWHTSGWADVSAIVLASLVGSVLLGLIVEKSKKCLDFSVTLFLLHLVLTALYGGFPTVLDWWIVHVFGTIVMVLLGEYLCSLKELSDIPLLEL